MLIDFANREHDLCGPASEGLSNMDGGTWGDPEGSPPAAMLFIAGVSWSP